MFYVYEWFDINTNEIFYVGKGTGKRYHQKSKRNKLFQNYIENHECDSRIIKYFESEEEAFLFEHEKICELKKSGQCFCNLDNGGTGGTNFCWTPEMRQYKSQYNPMKSESQKIRMSECNPMKNPHIAKIVSEKKKRAVVIKGVFYNSTKEAGIALGRFPEQIQFWCKRGYDSDKEPCRYADEKQKEFVLKITNSKRVIVDDEVFNSITEAAKKYNVWPETIIKAIKNNRPFKGHMCRYDNQQLSQGNFGNSTLESSETNG